MASNIKNGSIALDGNAQALPADLQGAAAVYIAAYPANAADDLVIGDSGVTLTNGLPISKAAGPVRIDEMIDPQKFRVRGTAGGRVGVLAILP